MQDVHKKAKICCINASVDPLTFLHKMNCYDPTLNTIRAGRALFSQHLCTSGNKYDTFSICASNHSGYEINSSQCDVFHFQVGYLDFQDGRQIDHK